MKPYANLHTHSTHSDGQYTPAELAAVAKAEGYRALAITDHDTATAFPELKDACAREGLECIFAVEFSVREPIPCHVVGFDFDPEYPPMKEYLIKMGARQTDNTKCCFDEAISNGNIQGITWDEVLEYNRGIIWLCNNHVFRAMKAKGLVEDSQYIEWFYTNFDGPGAKYPPLYDFKTLPEIVDMIKKAGGFAVCAHPSKHILDNIDVLLDAGIEGLEILHNDLSKEEQVLAHKICMEKGLYISGGSDHDGLCGGLYDSFPSEEALKSSNHYIEPLSVGVYEHNFREIQTRKINR
jgi:predicted metal-dependent phosphoesterase TrpH